ncbi:Dynein axonemal heavy chain [Dirofilaria immitis]
MFHKYRRRSVKKNFCGLTSFEKFTVGLLVASVQHIYKGPAGFHFLELRINVDVGVHTEKFLLKCMAHARKTITEKKVVQPLFGLCFAHLYLSETRRNILRLWEELTKNRIIELCFFSMGNDLVKRWKLSDDSWEIPGFCHSLLSLLGRR